MLSLKAVGEVSEHLGWLSEPLLQLLVGDVAKRGRGHGTEVTPGRAGTRGRGRRQEVLGGGRGVRGPGIETVVRGPWTEEGTISQSVVVFSEVISPTASTTRVSASVTSALRLRGPGSWPSG